MRKAMSWALLVWIALSSAPATAQQPGKMYRVGVLSVRGGMEQRDEVFRQRLRELGYVEGKNLSIEWKFSDGKPDRLEPLTAELVKLNVDVIFGNSTPAILAAKKVTKTISIVMTAGADPAETGLVASLERPGGNITGLTSVSTPLNGKRMPYPDSRLASDFSRAKEQLGYQPDYSIEKAVLDYGATLKKLEHL